MSVFRTVAWFYSYLHSSPAAEYGPLHHSFSLLANVGGNSSNASLLPAAKILLNNDPNVRIAADVMSGVAGLLIVCACYFAYIVHVIYWGEDSLGEIGVPVNSSFEDKAPTQKNKPVADALRNKYAAKGPDGSGQQPRAPLLGGDSDSGAAGGTFTNNTNPLSQSEENAVDRWSSPTAKIRSNSDTDGDGLYVPDGDNPMSDVDMRRLMWLSTTFCLWHPIGFDTVQKRVHRAVYFVLLLSIPICKVLFEVGSPAWDIVVAKQDPTTGQDNVAINNIRYNETTGNQDNGKNVGDYVTYVLECLGLCIPLLILLSSWTYMDYHFFEKLWSMVYVSDRGDYTDSVSRWVRNCTFVLFFHLGLATYSFIYLCMEISGKSKSTTDFSQYVYKVPDSTACTAERGAGHGCVCPGELSAPPRGPTCSHITDGDLVEVVWLGLLTSLVEFVTASFMTVFLLVVRVVRKAALVRIERVVLNHTHQIDKGAKFAKLHALFQMWISRPKLEGVMRHLVLFIKVLMNAIECCVIFIALAVACSMLFPMRKWGELGVFFTTFVLTCLVNFIIIQRLTLHVRMFVDEASDAIGVIKKNKNSKTVMGGEEGSIEPDWEYIQQTLDLADDAGFDYIPVIRIAVKEAERAQGKLTGKAGKAGEKAARKKVAGTSALDLVGGEDRAAQMGAMLDLFQDIVEKAMKRSLPKIISGMSGYMDRLAEAVAVAEELGVDTTEAKRGLEEMRAAYDLVPEGEAQEQFVADHMDQITLVVRPLLSEGIALMRGFVLGDVFDAKALGSAAKVLQLVEALGLDMKSVQTMYLQVAGAR